MCSRWHWVRACSLSLFFVRILRFSHASHTKILGFFLWLNAKKLERQPAPPACSAHMIFNERH